MSTLDPRDLEPPQQTLILVALLALLVVFLFNLNGVPV